MRLRGRLMPVSSTVTFRWLCGYTNKEVATAVHLAVGTVRNHMSVILEKLAARDRTQAAWP
jgi:DNA-binding NarL/FixJ family response regulator